ncbi:efflux RND transporter periplasmic adaptor subunit [Acuticoccus kandeliae]|uniref:efflux RND transporter periplasmic adaptor subunit n=1 Tax=Acuticoccus kandeliae TaxID=2073160 RepID=UPI001300BEE8|nr:efflux RND transporter periplasmic adaptor subunit [Acuticoccus kandeliae]
MTRVALIEPPGPEDEANVADVQEVKRAGRRGRKARRTEEGGGGFSRFRRLVGRMLRLLFKAAVPIFLLYLAVLAFSGLKASRPEVPRRGDLETVIPITTHEAVIGTFQPEMRLYGEVIPGQKLEVRALVGGKISSTSQSLRDGGFVQGGELLFEVDRFRYQVALGEARQSLAEAEARLSELKLTAEGESERLELAKRQFQIASKDLERARSLISSQSVAERTADDREIRAVEQQLAVVNSENKVKLNETHLAQQEAVIERLRQAVALAERDLDDTRVVAPYDGFVGGVTAEVGRFVTANEQIAVLYDADWLEVRFVMSNSQFARVVATEGTIIGRAVTVRWNVGSDPMEFRARIERIGAEIDAETGGIEVFARIEGIDHTTLLRSGAFVEVFVPDRPYENVVRLPEAAVYDSRRVFVVGADERLEERPVTVVGRNVDQLFVTGEFDAGQKILTMRLPGVGEGLKVRAQ